MHNMKRLVTVLLPLIFSCALANALPGFKPAIQDLPGQYVYYGDRTFKRESYTGFMCFSESSYAARYYAPAVSAEKLPEIDVEIYFTLNPEKNYIELTGERIISGFTPEEAEYVNYLHDLLYELNARRIKTPEANNAAYRKNDFFSQFGGQVTIEFNPLVPLFNVLKIFQDEALPDLYVVTCGQITATTDKSFEKFTGFPEKYNDNRHSMPKVKKASKTEVTTADNQKFTIDSAWNQSMENVWTLGDAALISATTIPDAPENFVTRQLLLSSGDRYLNWNDYKFSNENGLIKIECIFYQPGTKNISRNFKVAKHNKDGYKFFTMTVYNNVYSKNKKYFDSILKSYN